MKFNGSEVHALRKYYSALITVYSHFVMRSNHLNINIDGKKDEIFVQKLNVMELGAGFIIVFSLGLFIPTIIKAISTALILQSDRTLHSF